MRAAAFTLAALLAFSVSCRKSPTESEPTPPQAPEKPAGISARFEGGEITDEQVDRAYSRMLIERQMQAPLDPAAVQQIRRSVAEGLAIEASLLKRAQDAGAAPAETVIEAEIAKAKAKFPTVAEFQSFLVSRGMTEADFAEMMRKNLMIEALMQKEVAEKNPLTDQDIALFYEANKRLFYREESWRVSEIFIPFEGDEQKALLAVNAAHKRLSAGEDFAKLASTLSKGPTKDDGGSKGFLRRGGRPFVGDEQIFALQAGQFTPPIRYNDGYRIFKCNERLPAAQIGIDDAEVRAECQKRLYAARNDELVQSVKQQAKIQVY